MMYVEFMKIFFPADSSELIYVRVISSSWAQKRVLPLSRHDVTRVYKKIFFLPDSRELVGVRVISACLAQKRLIPTF